MQLIRYGVVASQWADFLARVDRRRLPCTKWIILTSATVLYMTDPSEARFMKCALRIEIVYEMLHQHFFLDIVRWSRSC